MEILRYLSRPIFHLYLRADFAFSNKPSFYWGEGGGRLSQRALTRHLPRGLRIVFRVVLDAAMPLNHTRISEAVPVTQLLFREGCGDSDCVVSFSPPRTSK